MISVLRQLPRNTRIMQRGERCRNHALAHARRTATPARTPIDRASGCICNSGGSVEAICGSALRMPATMASVEVFAGFLDGEQNAALSILANDVLLHREAIAYMGHIVDEYGPAD